METFLLDTNIASLLHPQKQNSLLYSQYSSMLLGKSLAISFQTEAELWSWGFENNWGLTRIRNLEQFISQFIIIPTSKELAKVWALVRTKSKQQGRFLETADAWIIATGVYYEIPVVTHDKDFIGLNIPGLTIITFLDNE